jgi:predicted enzyme related to lactoylglutathione lyase
VRNRPILPGRLLVILAALCVTVATGAAQNRGAETPAPAGDVTGVGTYIHVVSNLDRALGFYRALFGVDEAGAAARPYAANEPVATMYNIPGGKFRGGTLNVPNSELALEFLDWQDNRSPHVEARIYDLGAPVIILQIRNLDAALDAVKTHGGSILTPKGEPVRFSSPQFSPRRLIVVRDPDGYFIELIAPDDPPAAAQPGNVASAAFRFTVADANRGAHFFQQALGFNISDAGDFNNDAVLGAMTGLGVAVTRFARSIVPGSSLGIQFAEYKVADTRRVDQGLPRAGTSMLRLFVRDLDASLAKAKAAGATVAPGNDPPVTLGNGRRMAVIVEPNGLLVQLAERR